MTDFMPAAPDHSMLGLFLQADIVVKAVMLLLLLASIACWAIVVDKIFALRRLKREAAAVEAATARPGLPADTGLLPLGSHMLQRGLAAWRDSDGEESRKDRRERIERAMRASVAAYLRKVEPGLPFLATLGSAAPFVGLFGTVWGIMNSFTAIAQSNDTSLAVVAPGIAEALLATALGLVAAIPAVIAYNKFATDLGRIGQRFSACIGVFGERLTAAEADTARIHVAE